MEIRDYSHWEEYKDNSMGSGRSEKIWLSYKNEIGLFKFPKQFSDKNITTEHISEKLASEIAGILDIPCAKVEIGTYNGRLGSISYKINKDNEFLLEGINFINKSYPNYDIDTLYDPVEQVYYSFPMISPIIESLSFEKEFVEMVAFDALIGNSDRHHSNWALLVAFQSLNKLRVSFSPLYDNGSSLCCYIKEKDIDSFLGKDTRRLQSLVQTKSKSRIRIDAFNKKEPQHLDVLAYMLRNDIYKTHFIAFAKKILERLDLSTINHLLHNYPNNLLSDNRKKLIEQFLLQKCILFKRTLEKGG